MDDHPTNTVDVAELSQDQVDRLRLVLLRLARSIRRNAAGDISPSQFAVLAIVHRYGPCTIGEIADHERVQPPTISKIVGGLERLGLLERTIDPDDRRCARVLISTSGAEHIAAARAAGRSWLASRLAELPDTERAQLAGSLPVLEHLLGEVV